MSIVSIGVFSTIIPTVILFGALATDLRSHKILNKWVAISIILALLNSFYFYGWSGLEQGLIAGGVVLVVMIPLVLIGALGAGDMKILFAFALTATFQEVFSVFVFSILWGGVIGVGMAIYRGQAKRLFGNTVRILTAKPRDIETYQRIPYTIALVLGWVTYLFIGVRQGGIF